MAISRGQLVKELEPGLNALFGLEYKRYENQHAEIFDTETSDRAFEEEVMLSGFANAQVKPEGSGVSRRSGLCRRWRSSCPPPPPGPGCRPPTRCALAG